MSHYKDKYIKYKTKYFNMFGSAKDQQYSNKEIVLGVRDPWLFYIQIGKKTVEGRPGDVNKFRDWIGKTVKFVNKTRSFPVKVVAVRHYSTLKEYLEAEGYDKVLPGIKSFDEAINMYHEFYSDEDIKKRGGMNGIEVELV